MKRGEITLIQTTAVLGIICLRFEHQKARLASNYSEMLAVKFSIVEKAIYSSPSQIKKSRDRELKLENINPQNVALCLRLCCDSVSNVK